jgi:hypothetical protein|nr:MAG TPA: antilipopolysaccharide factor, Lipid A binding protein [Bacteriophage sp.]
MKQSTKVVLSSTVATLFCLGGAAICKKMGSNTGATICGGLAFLNAANGVKGYIGVRRAEEEVVNVVQKQLKAGHISQEQADVYMKQIG